MDHPSDELEQALGRWREYLCFLARIEIDPRLAPKLDPSDIVQQTLLEAYRDWPKFKGESDAERAAWLRRMLARNLADALKHHRRGKRDANMERSLEQSLADSTMRLGGFLAADHSTPSQQADRNEQIAKLADALAGLPDAQREVLVLRHWHNLAIKEIAERMQRSTTAVAGLLHRALTDLRKTFQAEE